MKSYNVENHLSNVVKSLPLTCGVYIMKSKEGDILYVGKTLSLRKRVHSYFLKNIQLKRALLTQKIADIDYVECDSEEQALILEAALIKEKKPRYNVALRDSKGYPYVEITRDEFPRIYITRKRQNKKSLYFGPYPKTKVIKSALNLMRRVFPFCTCRCLKNKECLFAHLGLCPAPCVGKISISEYKGNIEAIIKILKGERGKLIEYLRNRMLKFSDENKFEEAAATRDKLTAISNLYQGKTLTHELIALKETLNLKIIPLHIEAIDISSFGEGQASGSVVVFKNAMADKSYYRRYRIKQVTGINDYAMIAEVVQRRYLRQVNEKKRLPDLIIIDGGLAHVATAKKELEKLNLNIPVIGIAKRNEEIWFPYRNEPLIIPKDSLSLHLIQRIRDEAHRFAHKYHVFLRKKRLAESR